METQAIGAFSHTVNASKQHDPRMMQTVGCGATCPEPYADLLQRQALDHGLINRAELH